MKRLDKVANLVLKNRSYRRFDGKHKIPRDILRGLVNLGRLSPSGANLQPLKYIISGDKQTNARIYPHLRWAGYLKDWDGPEEGERPTGYIIILNDRTIAKDIMTWPGRLDAGIAAEAMLLGAVSVGLGGCIIAAVDRERLAKELKIADNLEIVVVIALGKPVEEVVIEDRVEDIKYYRKGGIHHVPKRKLEEVLIAEYLSLAKR